MKLSRLLEVLSQARLVGPSDLEITALTYNSRRSQPGCLFVAIRGYQQDGHDFVADAIERGARAIVCERPVPVPKGIARIEVPSSRWALAQLAAQFYGHPSKQLRLIGVTGTNGKTTTTHLIRAILREHGEKVGLIGTVQNFVGEEPRPVHHTTPESLDLQQLLAEMVDCGCTYAVMEVSSHALYLDRVASCEFDVGVFTNLTQDHLDFHSTLANYLESKARLFSGLGLSYRGAAKEQPKYAVINADDGTAGLICSRTRVPVVRYGVRGDADVVATDVQVAAGGNQFTLRAGDRRGPMKLLLRGRFNVYNALAAAAVSLYEGVPLDTVQRALAAIPGVSGRLESVAEGQDFTVFVDYAHTPDGLENILQTALELAERRVIVVFGCGGDRDRGKRPIMGRLAARYADHVIITSDNPRSEDPEAIIREIEAGVREEDQGRGRYETIVDRERAIERAIAMARKGDVVLIAGKGHEDYQIFRDRTIRFDDREVAHAKLRQRLAAIKSQQRRGNTV